MNVGIPREISADEKRIALTPVGVYALTQHGHRVYVESKAGQASGFHDHEFKEVGAEILFSHEEVLRRADLVAKVEAPSEEESRHLSGEQVLFAFLNPGVMQRTTLRNLQKNGATAFGYEYIEDADGKRPVLHAMSEIAGCLLPQIAGHFLECESGGRGILLSKIAGVPPATVVILGAGVVGFNAARAFTNIGASVIVLDTDVERLGEVDHYFNKRVVTSIVTPYNLERFSKIADVLIGAVLVREERAPHLITEEMVAQMRKGSVIIDVSIDQGGCIQTSRPTTLADPVFVKHGVIHYCVPNMTASVARTASKSLNNAVVSLIMQIAEKGVLDAVKGNLRLENGLYLYNGICTKASLSKLFDLEFRSLSELIQQDAEL